MWTLHSAWTLAHLLCLVRVISILMHHTIWSELCQHCWTTPQNSWLSFHSLLTQHAATAGSPTSQVWGCKPAYLYCFQGLSHNFFQVFISVGADGDKHHVKTTSLSTDRNNPQQTLSYKRRLVFICCCCSEEEFSPFYIGVRAFQSAQILQRNFTLFWTLFLMYFLLLLLCVVSLTSVLQALQCRDSIVTPTSTANFTSNVIIKHFLESWTLDHCNSFAFFPKRMHAPSKQLTHVYGCTYRNRMMLY